MPLDRMEHVLILAEDLAATRAFYVDLLGLEVGPRPDFSFDGLWLYLEDEPCIHVALRRDPPVPGSGRIDHVAFRGRDFEAMVQRLEAAGLPMRRREVPGRATRQIFVQDPNGVTIELNFPAEATTPGPGRG